MSLTDLSEGASWPDVVRDPLDAGLDVEGAGDDVGNVKEDTDGAAELRAHSPGQHKVHAAALRE